MHFPPILRLNTVKTGRSIVFLLRYILWVYLFWTFSENFMSSSYFSLPRWNHLNLAITIAVASDSATWPRAASSSYGSRSASLNRRPTTEPSRKALRVGPEGSFSRPKSDRQVTWFHRERLWSRSPSCRIAPLLPARVCAFLHNERT